jgi:hypothetical protein
MLDFNETQKIFAESEERAKTDRIELDTPIGKELGFTSDKFDGYLWKNGEFMTVSFIISSQEGKGNLSRLFKAINKKGYKIEVPTPFPVMELILKCHGFKRTIKKDPLMGKVEVWQQQGLKWKRDYIAIQKIMKEAEQSIAKEKGES